MDAETSEERKNGRGSIGARLWKMALGIFLATAGALLCVYLLLVYAAAREMDDWVERPALIAESRAVEGERDRFGLPRYHLQVIYRYDVDGKVYLSEGVKRLPIVKKTREGMAKWLERFPVGAELVCYTDPDDPARALLLKNSKAALYSLWFPALFVIGGLGIAGSAVRGSPHVPRGGS